MTNRLSAFACVAAVAALLLSMTGTAKADKYRAISVDWEVAAPGANTDAITDITWSSERALRLTIQCDTSTVVNLMVTSGATENALGMNANTALVAGALYTFDVHGVPDGATVNVQVETDSALPVVAVGEIMP